MNVYELRRVIDFLERTRSPYLCHVPGVEPDGFWNIVVHLIRGHISGQPTTISYLANISGIPYATALRKVHRMIDDGLITKAPRTRSGKSFNLVPSPHLYDGFLRHAQQVKSLLAETYGRSIPGEDVDDYYFGGEPRLGNIIPPLPLLEHGTKLLPDLKFLLHDDNYFSSMRNMWVDFRANLASRKNFEMLDLPRLHARLLDNGAQAASQFDVVTLNIPWLGEMAEKGLIRPLDAFIHPNAVNRDDFHPTVWRTGAWHGRQYAVPIYITLETLAVRRDLLDAHGLGSPRSFQNVIGVGRTLHAPQRGQFGVVWNAAQGMPVAHSFMFFLGCCGESVLNHAAADGADHMSRTMTPDDVTIRTPAALRTLDFMHELVSISPPHILEIDWNQSLDIFMRGNAAMAYVWTMRAARFEYDIHSQVKRRVEYLPHPAGPNGGSNTPLGGFLLAVPSNLPEERAALAFGAIAWMASPEAMKAHVKNGFPAAPRFSVAADPEAAASSPIVGFVDRLAKRNMLHTWQRPAVPRYKQIEQVLGEEIHAALSRRKSDAQALMDAQARVEALFRQV
jgi:multiple sugar transport system substrate-binding protein